LSDQSLRVAEQAASDVTVDTRVLSLRLYDRTKPRPNGPVVISETTSTTTQKQMDPPVANDMSQNGSLKIDMSTSMGHVMLSWEEVNF